MDTSGSIQVLVVDDEPAAREVLVTTFEVAGFSVAAAENGDVALASVRLHHPAVVVTDVQMPGMNGYELARRLREEYGEDGPSVIAATGDPGIIDRLHSDSNFLAVFRKPPDIFDLLRIVRSCMGEGSRPVGP